MSAINIQKQIALLRRQLRENDMQLTIILMERNALTAELDAAAIRYQDTLSAGRLREQAAGVVAAAERWLAGE